MGRDDGKAGARVGAERRAAVEAEPADPQQPGADHRQRQIVGREILGAVAAPRAEHESGDQPGDAGIEMHHRAAGEIEHARRLPRNPPPQTQCAIGT